MDSQLASLSPNNVQVVTAGGSSNATSFLVDLTAQSAQDPGFSAASWGLFSRSGPGSSSKVGAANGVVHLKQSGSGGRVAELIVQDSSCQLSNVSHRVLHPELSNRTRSFLLKRVFPDMVEGRGW